MSILNEEHEPLLDVQSKHNWRWFILLTFSLYSFSNSLMWITFAPCLYLFTQYYFQSQSTYTLNAINSLSSVYMLIYPIAISFTFKYFEDKKDQEQSTYYPSNGLRKGIMIGIVLNTAAGGIRYLGAIPSLYGFILLFTGQTIAAIAQVFMLSIPPRLAVAWFPENEINLATAIAVSANNLGIAAGCALTPLMIRESTMYEDIPQLLLLQFIMCLVVFILVWIAFRQFPPYLKSVTNEVSSINQSVFLWKQRKFLYMVTSYGIVMGAQCAIITLLAQILIPPFRDSLDEKHIGLLGAAMLFIGFPASIIVGCYLDHTLRYKNTLRTLFVLTAISILMLYASIEYSYLIGVVVSCLLFGLFSYAISPAFFQYASELFYPISEIIPTGYLFTVGNTGGVLLVALMGWSENNDRPFTMSIPMLGLSIAMLFGCYFIFLINGTLKRSCQMNTST
ncbi:major facilitator superfamily domain-containing protein [Pilobolus umbonatus]|nr:major facilitator superfamily domain-containing protein [Pilobolus umbonatus]